MTSFVRLFGGALGVLIAVVLASGAGMIEREIDVTLVRVLQTVAGRMVFAQPR